MKEKETCAAPNSGFPVGSTASEPPARPGYLSVTSNTVSVTETVAAPPRYRNQDSNCLVCLAPVTPTDLLVIDLRCVACPRVFHGACLTYIPPSMNQNWRCSLCYREAWHGYGHLPIERDVQNPCLVERYRRRLLLAKTYGHPAAGPDSVRFWFDVDMDGGMEADQAVLVRMGLVNGYKLRVVGDGVGGASVRTVEGMERWAIALGTALQEEEAKVEALTAELGRLRAFLG